MCGVILSPKAPEDRCRLRLEELDDVRNRLNLQRWRSARTALERVPAEHAWSLWSWYWQEMFEDRYAEALASLESTPGDWIRTKICIAPKSLFAAEAHELLGETALARSEYEVAARLLEAEIPSDPDDSRRHSSLGLAYAGLGRKDEAIAESERALALRPLSNDALYGLPNLVDQAYTYTLVGEYNRAIDRLEQLLTLPSWISVTWLRMDPRWDRLREHPRYRELLERYE